MDLSTCISLSRNLVKEGVRRHNGFTLSQSRVRATLNLSRAKVAWGSCGDAFKAAEMFDLGTNEWQVRDSNFLTMSNQELSGVLGLIHLETYSSPLARK